MLQIRAFAFNALQENTYVLFDETKDCVIIDPGCYDEDEKSELQEFVKSNDLKVTRLLNTHCHVDHVLGNYFVKESYKVKLSIHRLEIPVLKAVAVYAPSYGFYQYEESEPDDFLAEGDRVSVGKHELTVIFVPGVSHPQIGLACFCCNTMWSPMMAGSLSSARRSGASASPRTRKTRRCFIG